MHLILLMIMVLGLTGCQSATPENVQVVRVTPDVIQFQQTQPAPAKVPPLVPDEHRLKAQDKLQATIYSTLSDGTVRRLFPPLTAEKDNIEIIVLPDGTVNMPMIGLVSVHNLTLAEAQEKIIGVYRDQKVFNEPSVLLAVMERTGHTVTVLGAVREPGEVILSDNNVNLLTALGRAKGTTQTADISNVTVRRANGEQSVVNVRSMLADATPPPLLVAGDVIFVPEEKAQQAYVLGDVVRPQAVSFQQGRLSTLQAITMAGGFDLRFANASHVYVVRGFEQSPNGVTIFQFDMADPARLSLAEQFDLQPRDIVYVSATALADWNRFISLLLPTNLNTLRNTEAYSQ